MQIITLQVDRRMLMVFGLLLMLWGILTILEEKKRRAMCNAIMKRQDDLELLGMRTAALSLVATEAAQKNRSAAQLKKTATRRK